MLKRYDTASASWVDAESVKRFDTPTNSWVDVGGVKAYDTATASWVEKLCFNAKLLGQRDNEGLSYYPINNGDGIHVKIYNTIYAYDDEDFVTFGVEIPNGIMNPEIKFSRYSTSSNNVTSLIISGYSDSYGIYTSSDFWFDSSIREQTINIPSQYPLKELRFNFSVDTDNQWAYTNHSELFNITINGIKVKFPANLTHNS